MRSAPPGFGATRAEPARPARAAAIERDMAKGSNRKSPRRGTRRRPVVRKSAGYRLFGGLLALFAWAVVGIGVVLTFALGAYMMQLDGVIRAQFEGKRWALPARVYARPMELFPGAVVSGDELARELELLGFWQVERLQRPGGYVRAGNRFDIHTRTFAFWDGTDPSQRVQVSFEGGRVASVRNVESGEALGLMRLEPAEIAAIYPAHREDRILVKREEMPPVLVDALMAVEDRKFYDHFGVDPRGITRAAWANFRAGRTVQGGSTLTQQLVKNYFLSNERSYVRKVNEALMAVLLEWHYDKDQILEAYANEVYLGQDGSRAIHGLGLASRFYFGRHLSELNLHHMAMLVGLIRGPSQYDPRRFPERALARRSLVLDIMVEQNLISRRDADIARELPLDVVERGAPSGLTPYPGFVDLVQRQLRELYREEDLTSEGLRIFTTLDPAVQATAEQALVSKLPDLERTARLEAGTLQGAVVVADPHTGEIQAIVGGRDVQLAGFNRALDAVRQPGSLIKAPIYLTALEYPTRYTLATLLDDTEPVIYTTSTGQTWSPGNYDGRFHGYVTVREALARSYNVPTVRMGMDLDVLEVIRTINRLGVPRRFAPFPSLLLGAVDMTVLEVAQLYEAFASGGYRIPLRAIREVTTADGEPLNRYPLEVVKVIEPGPAYLITQALQTVVSGGTGASINRTLPRELRLAGKTGTTNDYRDSWFAGFSGNRLAVVWVGRDDNTPTRLSGSAGALPIWIELMSRIPQEPLTMAMPQEVEVVRIDPVSGLRADSGCPDALPMPFLAGSAPTWPAPCSDQYQYTGPYEGVPTTEDYAGSVPPPPAQNDPIENFFRRLLQ